MPHPRLGKRLSEIYELRLQKCNGEIRVFKPSIEMEKFLELEAQTIDEDITVESTRSRNAALACIPLEDFDLAVVVRLFQLHGILATAPGSPQPRDVWRLFEKELIPDLIKWRSKFQVPSHFACFRSYVIAYLKNWCLSGVFGDHEVAVKELKETLSPEKFKDAVLKTCPDDYQQTLHRIYCLPEMQKADQKQNKSLMSSLQKLVQDIKLNKGTLALPEMHQLGLMVGRGEIASLLKSIAKKMEGILPMDRDVESEMVYSPPDEDAYTYSKDQVRQLYTACVVAQALCVKGVIYHSQHEASFEVVYEVLRLLWKLYWKWNIAKDKPQQERYRSFCYRYTLLYLHSSQRDLVREILTLPSLQAGVFNGTTSDEIQNKFEALNICKKRKRPPVDEEHDPKRQKRLLAKESVGGMLEESWERDLHAEKLLFGPMEDPDLLLMSEINSSGQSAMSGLKEWKEAHKEEHGYEDTESIKRTLLELYEKKYGKPMRKPESILFLARMACKVHLLGLDEVVYGLSGTIFYQLICPLRFLFRKKVTHRITKSPLFVRFAKYYLYHSLRLETTDDLFDAKWTSDKTFMAYALTKCHPDRIQEVQSLLIPKLPDPRVRRDSWSVDGC